MPEPRIIAINAHVSTEQLRQAVKRLPLARYPARLQVIDQELIRRQAVERSKAA
jgi:hypothetical protein